MRLPRRAAISLLSVQQHAMHEEDEDPSTTDPVSMCCQHKSHRVAVVGSSQITRPTSEVWLGEG